MKTVLLVWVALFMMIPTMVAGIDSDNYKINRSCQAQIDSAILYMTHRRYTELAHLGGKIESAGKKDKDNVTENIGKALRLRGLVNSYSDTGTSDYAMSLSNVQRSILAKTESGVLDSLTIVSMKPEIREMLSYINLALASFCLNSDMDYSLAMEYASNARLLGQTIPMPIVEAEAMGLLSCLMLINHDPAGIRIFEQGLVKARKSGNVSMVFTLLANLANMKFEDGKHDEAFTYLQEADKVAVANGMRNERIYIHTFYGNIYSHLERYAEAEKEYLKAVASPYKGNIYYWGYALYSYGTFLQGQHRYAEALKVFRTAKNEAAHCKPLNYYGGVLQGIVDCEETLGHYREALQASREYSDFVADMQSRGHETDACLFHLWDEVSKQRETNALQKLELAEKQRSLLILGAVALFILLAAVAVIVIWRRTRSYYRNLVKANLNWLEETRQEEGRMKADVTAKEIPDERKNIYLDKLDRLMKEDKIYREADLTLEKAAMMVGTNRTYLSQIINEKTGSSYSTYVNEFRLCEAMEILSNPDCKDPMKAVAAKVGFASLSNFYTLFKQKTGISPAVFQKTASKLRGEGGISR